MLSQAARDFFLFQNRGYPRSSSLEWVGNRYRLTQLERKLLDRGVCSQADALSRRAKKCRGSDWQGDWLVVDGHNVQITVESALAGRILLKANDGALRDLAGQSARFRFTEAGESALDSIFRYLEKFPPTKALFLFDAPMSHSGQLAEAYRRRLKQSGIYGDARAVPVPEREFPYESCVVASSDRAVLDASGRWLDLACAVLDAEDRLDPAADFSSLLLSSCDELDLPGGPDFFEGARGG